MTLEGILGIVILIVLFLGVAYMQRLYWRMRSDNGYNMGRNHMHDLGFSDKDIEQGQDDEDADLYVFRKKHGK
ncbi:MAG: hypothetical protein IIY93_13335 [Clostridia bacterium]|nr:hypothetical protein [Clostridia bacterium]MBQ1553936.1 hypothetical protein [Clostridia bacterium]